MVTKSWQASACPLQPCSRCVVKLYGHSCWRVNSRRRKRASQTLEKDPAGQRKAPGLFPVLFTDTVHLSCASRGGTPATQGWHFSFPAPGFIFPLLEKRHLMNERRPLTLFLSFLFYFLRARQGLCRWAAPAVCVYRLKVCIMTLNRMPSLEPADSRRFGSGAAEVIPLVLKSLKRFRPTKPTNKQSQV